MILCLHVIVKASRKLETEISLRHASWISLLKQCYLKIIEFHTVLQTRGFQALYMCMWLLTWINLCTIHFLFHWSTNLSEIVIKIKVFLKTICFLLWDYRMIKANVVFFVNRPCVLHLIETLFLICLGMNTDLPPSTYFG